MGQLKKMKVVSALLALTLLLHTTTPANAQLQLLAELGVALQLEAAVSSVIQIASEGLSFAVTPSAPCSITINSVGSLLGILGGVGATNLPAGCTQLVFGGGGLLGLGQSLGYTIQTSPSTVALNAASIITGVVQNSGAISSSSPCGCVTPVGSGYASVSGVSYSGGSGSVTIPVSSTACQATGYATYIPVAIQSQVQSQLGSAVAICGNSQQTINYGSQVALQYASAAENTITCTQSSVAAGAGAGASALIGAGNSIGSYTQYAMQSAAGATATIHATYTAQQLASAGVCNANNLRIAAYNSGCGCFRVPSSGGSVNTGGNYVSQAISTSSYSNSIPQCAVVEAPYTLGNAVAVQGAQYAKAAYTSGAAFSGYTSGASKITVSSISSYTSVPTVTSLPSGCTPLAFQGSSGASTGAGAGCGYHVQSSGGSVSSPYVYTAPVTSACASQIESAQASGGYVDCLHYNSAGQYQGSLGTCSYNKANGCVSTPVPSCSSAGDHYVFVCRK